MYLENSELKDLERILDVLLQNEEELHSLLENYKSNSFGAKLNKLYKIANDIEKDKTNTYRLRKHINETNREYNKNLDLFDKFSNNYKNAKVEIHRIQKYNQLIGVGDVVSYGFYGTDKNPINRQYIYDNLKNITSKYLKGNTENPNKDVRFHIYELLDFLYQHGKGNIYNKVKINIDKALLE